MNNFDIPLGFSAVARANTCSSTTPPPLVILIGWYASTLRQLRKYEDLHRLVNPSATLVTLTLPKEVVFGSPLSLDSGVNSQVAILDALSLAIKSDARLSHSSVTIHAFSNGAVFLTRHLNYPCEFFDTYPHIRYLKENLKNIIYDSSPVYPSISLGARALAIGTGYTKEPNSLLELLVMKPALLTTVAVKHVLRYAFGEGVEEGNNFATFWNDMMHGVINDSCRELYLYSDTDHLTPVDRLDELIHTRKGKGLNVTSVRFKGTGHVRHMLEKRDVYEGAVISFLLENKRMSKL